jgi:hypothetical protein
MNKAPEDRGDAPKRIRATGKWTFFMGLAGLFCLLFIAIYLGVSNNNSVDHSSSSGLKPDPVKTKNGTLPGGEGTPNYNNNLRSSIEKSQIEAQKNNASFIPPVIGGEKIDAQKMLTPTPMVDVPKPPTVSGDSQKISDSKNVSHRKGEKEEDPALLYKQSMLKAMDTIAQVNGIQPQVTYTFIKPEKDVMISGEQPVVEEKKGAVKESGDNKIMIPPGTILYAINDLHLNSDGGNTVRATVVSGNFKDYVALGAFVRKNETLHLEFNKIVAPNGIVYSIDGLAIDPEKSSENVASAVDNHYLQRWGGVAAGAFIEGLAQATQASGSAIGIAGRGSISGDYDGGVGLGYSGGVAVQQNPAWSVDEKMTIAAGSVGRRFSQALSQNFNRPPTVELFSGQPIGILIMDSK